MDSEIKRMGGAATRRLLWLALVVAGCGKTSHGPDSKVEGVCETNAECTPGVQECRSRVFTNVDQQPVGNGGSAGSEPTPIGGSVNGGAGPAKICSPNEPSCDGNRPTTCNGDGTGYVGGSADAKGCAPSLTCVVSAGAAECAGECGPQQTRCAGDGLQTCGADGHFGPAVACGEATPVCYSNACKPAPPSCSGLAATCGPASNESCCVSPTVKGGTFNRENDPRYSATVSTFRLDKYEVTVGRFRKFVDAVVAGWLPVAGSGKHTHLNGGAGLTNRDVVGNEPGWDTAWNKNLPAVKATWDGPDNLDCQPAEIPWTTWTPTSGTNETKPINCVSWYQSAAFCIWDGGFLPSEAEWNYAAAGGSAQRTYPWGETVPGADATLAIYGCYFDGMPICSGVEDIAAVGTAATRGVYGQADLAGNVYEWNLDFAGPGAACIDCAYLQAADAFPTPAPLTNRELRGGAFGSPAAFLLSSERRSSLARVRDYNNGLRCARAP